MLHSRRIFIVVVVVVFSFTFFYFCAWSALLACLSGQLKTSTTTITTTVTRHQITAISGLGQ